MKQKRGSEIEALRAEWYARLKSDGFRDIERLDASDPYSHLSLRDSSGARLARFDLTSFQANRRYWELAATFSQTFTFKSELQRECFELFARGMTYRKIASQVHRNHVRVYQLVKPVIDGPFRRFIKESLSVCSMLEPELEDEEVPAC